MKPKSTIEAYPCPTLRATCRGDPWSVFNLIRIRIIGITTSIVYCHYSRITRPPSQPLAANRRCTSQQQLHSPAPAQLASDSPLHHSLAYAALPRAFALGSGLALPADPGRLDAANWSDVLHPTPLNTQKIICKIVAWRLVVAAFLGTPPPHSPQSKFTHGDSG